MRLKDYRVGTKGVTLVELMVVLAVMGILSAIVFPDVRKWVENYRVKGTIRQLITDLQFAKMKAVSEGVQYRVTFNNTNETYIIEKGNAAISSSVWTQQGITRELTNSSNPYHARGIGLNANNNSIIFSITGTASPAATIAVSGNTYTKNVTVLLTGRVRYE